MKLIVFDIDGTLTNTNDIDNICFEKSLADILERQVSRKDWVDCEHFSDQGICDFLFKKFKDRSPLEEEKRKLKSKMDQYLYEAHSQKPDSFQEVSGAASIIQQLKQHPDFRIAIATGCWEGSAQFKLKVAGIPFDTFPLAFADPHISRTSIMQQAIDDSKVYYDTSFASIVYVGDGPWDWNACTKLQIPFLGIDCIQSGQLKKLGDFPVLNDYSDSGFFLKTIYQLCN